MFTSAAAPFRIPKALTTGAGMRSWGWLMSKLPRELYWSATSFFFHCNVSIGRGVLPLGLRTPVLVSGDLLRKPLAPSRTIAASMFTHLDFTKGIALSTSVNRLDHISLSDFVCPLHSLKTAYHSDSSSKGSLVGKSVQRLKAGELSKSGIGAQRPGSKGRQNVASCGGGSGRMCQGGHRAHRGSGGNGIHCATIGLVYQRRYTKAHSKLLKLLWEVKLRVSLKRKVSNLRSARLSESPAEISRYRQDQRETGCSTVILVIIGNHR